MVTSLLRRSADSPRTLLDRYGSAMAEALDRREAGLSVQNEHKASRLDALMRRIVESNFDGILTLSSDNRVTMANDAAIRMLGYSLVQLQNLSPEAYFPAFRAFTERASDDYAVGRGYRETIAVNQNGTAVPAEICISDLTIRREKLRVIILRDITESKAQRRELEHQALHDALTGLPNRVLLNDRLDHAMKTAHRAGEPMALLLIDLDDFKDVNDTLGHHVGDLLLVEIAERLKRPLRDSDTVARLGGDEFAVLLPAATDMNRAVEIAHRLREAVLEPVQLNDDLAAFVGASIGVAMYPDHSNDAIRLMQCADVAMYCAKDGPDKIVLYDSEQDNNNLRSLTLSSSLRKAIDDEAVSLVFQPKLSLNSQKVTSVEALARWNDPTLGIVEPDEFIAHAERTGQIRDLTTMLVGKATKQIADWQSRGLDLTVSVNLSPRSLLDEGLPQKIQTILADHGVLGSKLTLEITETAIVLDPTKAQNILKGLNDLGIALSIDDFGTGYSSLSILQQLPVKELKVDRSFVQHMLERTGDDVIVRSTIALAHSLDMTVVAEGVETPALIKRLGDLDCDFVQGYAISTALDGPAFETWLSAYSPQIAPSIQRQT
ncbi:MAG: EAL domain-containing protein [Pseudomonadota bacterium]